MTATLDHALWEDVAGRLEGAARDWWDEDGLSLIGATVEEAQAIAEALAAGELTEAEYQVVRRMSREDWLHFTRGTIRKLRGVALRRAATIDALRALGEAAAKAVGAALLAAL